VLYYAIITALLVVLILNGLGYVTHNIFDPIAPFLWPLVALLATVLRLVKKFMKTYFDKAAYKLNVDRTRYVIFTKFAQVFIYIIGIILVVNAIPIIIAVG